MMPESRRREILLLGVVLAAALALPHWPMAKPSGKGVGLLWLDQAA
jgi:hypothetical protein